MSENIYDLAERSSITTTDAGFTHCDVHSEPNRELAFHFDDHLSAHAFQGKRELLGMRARIDDDNQTVVIVTQQ